eukprot:COSAG01_NODE_1963_length_8785_cov_56.285402_7_plen_167_part_00
MPCCCCGRRMWLRLAHGRAGGLSSRHSQKEIEGLEQAQRAQAAGVLRPGAQDEEERCAFSVLVCLLVGGGGWRERAARPIIREAASGGRRRAEYALARGRLQMLQISMAMKESMGAPTSNVAVAAAAGAVGAGGAVGTGAGSGDDDVAAMSSVNEVSASSTGRPPT